MQAKTRRITIRLEEADFEWINLSAIQAGCSPSAFHRNLITKARRGDNDHTDLTNSIEEAVNQIAGGIVQSHNRLIGRLKRIEATQLKQGA